MLRDLALDAKRAAAAAGTLHIGIIELESRTFERFDVVDRNAFQVHLAHLVHHDLEAVKFIHVIARLVYLILKGHVIAKTRASAAHHGDPQPCRCRRLLPQNLLNLRNRRWRKLNHSLILRFARPLLPAAQQALTAPIIQQTPV